MGGEEGFRCAGFESGEEFEGFGSRAAGEERRGVGDYGGGEAAGGGREDEAEREAVWVAIWVGVGNGGDAG